MVNALSARLDVEVDRDGHEWAVSFRRGVPGEFAADGPDAASFTRGTGPAPDAARWPGSVTGTRIRFWPDRQMFTKDAELNFDGRWCSAPGRPPTSFPAWRSGSATTARAEPEAGPDSDSAGGAETAAEQPGPDSGAEKEAEFRFDGGISEFCEYLSPGEPLTDVLRLTGAGQFTETVPVLDDQGHMTPTDVERELQVDVALRWGTGYDTMTGRSST